MRVCRVWWSGVSRHGRSGYIELYGHGDAHPLSFYSRQLKRVCCCTRNLATTLWAPHGVRTNWSRLALDVMGDLLCILSSLICWRGCWAVHVSTHHCVVVCAGTINCDDFPNHCRAFQVHSPVLFCMLLSTCTYLKTERHRDRDRHGVERREENGMIMKVLKTRA